MGCSTDIANDGYGMCRTDVVYDAMGRAVLTWRTVVPGIGQPALYLTFGEEADGQIKCILCANISGRDMTLPRGRYSVGLLCDVRYSPRLCRYQTQASPFSGSCLRVPYAMSGTDLADAATSYNAPVLDSLLVPDSIPTTGGASVTVLGTGFGVQ
eukprot:2531161-Rhodomonas_salina.7